MASLRATHGSERILGKLSKLIESSEYYEAHQLYRTIYFRYVNAKRFKDLQNLLYNGAATLLERNQFNSGADVAVLYIDTLNQDADIKDVLKDTNECNQLCERIGKLMSMIPAGTPERLNFTLTTLKLKPAVFPIPLIHREFAMITWREKNYTDSRYHFLHCPYTCGEECATMLIEYHMSCGCPEKYDLFLAQFILQLLCLKKVSFDSSQNESTKPWFMSSFNTDGSSSSSLNDSLNLSKIIPKSNQHAFAGLTLQCYLAKHPEVQENKPPVPLICSSPLINFLWFLLLAIDSEKTTVFKHLCEIYAEVIKRDPAYREYLARIGEIYFGMRPPSTNRGFKGFLSNFLQSFAKDTDEEMGEEDAEAPSGSAPTTRTSNNISSQAPITRGEDLD